MSINEPLREVINPGASGSLFFVTNDDSYIIKTVQRVEAKFLQKLLPGYYMVCVNFFICIVYDLVMLNPVERTA